MMNTFRQVFFYNLSTPGAFLACAFWIDCFTNLASIFSFVSSKTNQLIPSGIGNTFCQKPASHHFANVQIFKENCVKRINEFSGLLVRKIITAVSASAVNFLQNLHSFFELFCAFLLDAQSAINFSQCFFIGLEKSRIFNLVAVGKCAECCQSDINSNHRLNRLNLCLAFDFTSEDDIPTVAFTPYRTSFNRAFNSAVQFDFNASDFGKMKFIIDDFESALNVTKRIVTTMRFEARETNFGIALSGAAEETVKRFAQSAQSILQNLAIHIFKFRTVNFNQWKLNSLRVKVNRNAVEFPSITAFLESGVIQFSTQIQSLNKLSLNGFARRQFEFVTFHYFYFRQAIGGLQKPNTQRNTPFPPNLKANLEVVLR